MHRKRNENTLIRRCCGALMCLMISAAMILPAAVPNDVFAEYSLQGSEQEAGIQSQNINEADLTDSAAAVLNADAVNSDDKTLSSDGTDSETEAAADGEAANTDSSDERKAEESKKKNPNVHSLFVSESVSEEAAAAKASSASLSKHFKLDDRRISFSDKVIKGSYLGSTYVPENVKIKAYKTKIKLSWTAPESTGFDGYIVIRRNTDQSSDENAVEEWTELKRLANTKLSYTDKTASDKDTEYRYAVAAYSKTNDGVKISHISDWASGVTTASSKANVSSVTLKNYAKTSALQKGKTVTISLTFPSKPFSKSLRWSSSDEAKATVDENGKVYGVKKGTVTITGKMHTGEVFSTKVRIIKGGTSAAMITVMKSWMGYSYANGKNKGIVDIYNSKKPLPVGYTLKYNDAWCDASISAAAIRSGCTELTGRECSVPRHITIFKNLGIWEENGKITPQPGDLIVYSWNKSKQPNNASASHIGIVESVKDGTITAIEGNKGSGEVARRYIPVGWGFIRGYAKPNYSDR